MEIKKTIFKNLLEIKIQKHNDMRGSFIKIFNKANSKKFKNECYESYISKSKKGVVRGLHTQSGKYAQDKLIYCIKGKLLDIAIDIRKNSKTFGKYYKVILSDKNNLGLYIPKGFAHAYYSYEKENIIYYKLNNYYQPKYEDGINVMDKKLNIKWPSKKFLISRKDKNLGTLEDFKKKYKKL